MAKVDWEEKKNLLDLSLRKSEKKEEKEIKPLSDGIVESGGSLSLQGKIFRSTGFSQATKGWKVEPNGDVEFNGNTLTSTNFTKVTSHKGVSIYCSDGTTPNGNLSGTAGDVCYNGPSGQPFYCGGGTTWTGM